VLLPHVSAIDGIATRDDAEAFSLEGGAEHVDAGEQ
jgi:hypothetical protein